MENGPFIVDFPIENADFPVRYVNVYQRVTILIFMILNKKKALEILTFSVQCDLFCQLELHQSNRHKEAMRYPP